MEDKDKKEEKQLGKVVVAKAISEQEDALGDMLKNKQEESADPFKEKKERWTDLINYIFLI